MDSSSQQGWTGSDWPSGGKRGSPRLMARHRAKSQPYARDLRAMVMGMMGAIDIATIVSIAVLAFMWRDGTTTVPPYYWLAIGLGTLLPLNTNSVAGIYDFRNMRPKTKHLGRLALSWSITILLLIAAFYLAKHSDDFSRTW